MDNNNGQVSRKNVDILSLPVKYRWRDPPLPPPLPLVRQWMQDEWEEPFVYRFLSKTSDSLSKGRQGSVEKVARPPVRREKVTARRRSRIVDQKEGK